VEVIGATPLSQQPGNSSPTANRDKNDDEVSVIDFSFVLTYENGSEQPVQGKVHPGMRITDFMARIEDERCKDLAVPVACQMCVGATVYGGVTTMGGLTGDLGVSGVVKWREYEDAPPSPTANAQETNLYESVIVSHPGAWDDLCTAIIKGGAFDYPILLSTEEETQQQDDESQLY
jgi:hypothetical protein